MCIRALVVSPLNIPPVLAEICIFVFCFSCLVARSYLIPQPRGLRRSIFLHKTRRFFSCSPLPRNNAPLPPRARGTPNRDLRTIFRGISILARALYSTFTTCLTSAQQAPSIPIIHLSNIPRHSVYLSARARISYTTEYSRFGMCIQFFCASIV